MPIKSAPQDRYMNDSALVEKAGPSITTIVPPGWTVMPNSCALCCTMRLAAGQNGSAKAMWTTMSCSKKVLDLWRVLSMSWLGTTRCSGSNSSFRLPTALTEITRSTPRVFSA